MTKLDDKNVLITGCDSGFGKALALQLSKKGVKVFAACLTEKGKTDFDGTKNVEAFLMDVSKPESVQNGVNFVKSKAPEGLWGLVNNAGVLRGGLLETSSNDDMYLQFNVNVYGMVDVTRSCISLLRKKKGRVVNISSVAGRFAMPATSLYSATKFAVQGLSDSLRRELHIWGVKVIIVEPGIMRTPLWDVPFDKQKMESNLKHLPDEVRELYGIEYFEKSYNSSKEMVGRMWNDPQMVVDILDEALTSNFPLTRYSIGKDTYFWFFMAYAPTWFSDLLLRLDSKDVPAALQKGKQKSK